MAAAKLVFAVNGDRFELSEVDPSTTLLEFLRTQTRFRAPKLGCGEGGCGACVVLLSTYDPVNDKVKESSVSSCLTLLYSVNFCSVTTSEGLGNSKDGFHSIHKRFAGFHASQCGFCTPGMCMSFYSALVNAEKTDRPQQPSGFSKLTKSEAENAIAGNLCRCTGYRPIIDACKSYAADIELEDLGLNTFWKKGKTEADVNKLPSYTTEDICTFPDFLKTEMRSFSNILNHSKTSDLPPSHWYQPQSVHEFYEILDSGEFMMSKDHTKIVASNTGSGVYKEHDIYERYIDLKGIAELSMIKEDKEAISFGAAVTISQAIKALRDGSSGKLLLNERIVFAKIADHMNKVASPFVRNTATLGGNLMMAQRNQFASDIATILLAAGSTVCLQMPSERLLLTLEEFLEKPPYDNKTLLISIHIPNWDLVQSSSARGNGPFDSKSARESSILFETYRAAPRPLGNAVAYLNSAFLARVSSDKASGNYVIDNIRLSFGAYGVEHAIRARKVEKYLVGKALSPSVLLEAIKLLKEEIIPKEGTAHSNYRISLAVAFLFKFLQPLIVSLIEHGENVNTAVTNSATVHGYSDSGINEDADTLSTMTSMNEQLDQINDSDLVLSSRQVLELGNDYHPVGEPIKKFGAEIQASGEAVYVDDIPSPKDTLYGAFVYSTKPLAHIKSIKFKSSSASEKIISFITVNDIPERGQNLGVSSPFGTDLLFAASLTEYAGQPLGLVIAEKQRYADMAAKQAIIDYSTENLEPPILSLEDAVKRSSYFKIPPMFSPQNVGDLTKGMAEADHMISSSEIKINSQYFFYMETQAALAIPDEDDCMVVYSSSQLPEITQGVIAKCLGIPEHNVRVITRRAGGGFGGKATKAIPAAAACAVAAFKLRRPVRMYIDRKTDMIIAGGRHPMKVNYSVGFKSNGKITALHIDLLINAGITEDFSPIIPINVMESLKKYNWGAISMDVKLCKTNLSSKTTMRAPGDLQGSYIAEVVMEHVASFLSMDTNAIRRLNLHTYDSLLLFYGDSAGEETDYTLPFIVDKLLSASRYLDHIQMVDDFNARNKWRKRGISLVPTIYKVILKPTPGKVSILNDGSVVVEVGGTEIGQGLWTKVQQMTAFSLGQLWPDGSHNLLEKIRIIQADSLSLIQGGLTAGSTTSEQCCAAVHLACNLLVARLKPLQTRLEEEMDGLTWDVLISQANAQAVNLSASIYWVPDSTFGSYLNYGAATSEVEVDVLTGATKILRTDIIYDCGQSLNHAVDLGQIEGAFVQGIGFFMFEEYLTNSDGLVVSDSTWTYKIPTVDTIPRQFNVEILCSGPHKNHVLSSKASGEPPLLLAGSVHCAVKEAIRAARSEFSSADSPTIFQLDAPATLPLVKELCGLDNVEKYLQTMVSAHR